VKVARALYLLALCAGCRTLPVTPPQVLQALEGGGYLSGTPVALGPAQVINREDFVYDARLSPDGQRFAFSRLGLKNFYLTTWKLSPVAEREADVAVNPLEFDVEMLDFSPDGAVVATVSKDGALRVFDAHTGAPRGAWLSEEPLVSVAFSADGAHLAVGSTRGLVTVLAWPALAFTAELRAHGDEVRALSFAPDGRLFTGGWDRQLRVFTLTPGSAPSREARVHGETKGGLRQARLVFDGQASATFAVDARVPGVVVTGALAQAVGLDVPALTETVEVPSASGPQLSKLARHRRLSFKGLTFADVDVAVCDACVPPQTQGVLGQAFLDRADVLQDASTQELVVRVHDGVTVEATSLLALTPAATFHFPASVNDFTLDAKGEVLGVAFSETKAERNREVYEREKRGEVEPVREWDCGARVDARTGVVLEKVSGHHGVVSTAAISPDGLHLVTGGWDKTLRLQGLTPQVETFGWSVRHARFSRDGRWLSVAAWTPANVFGAHQSDPSAVRYEVRYLAATVVR
jgi:WD40 repeat protein